MPLDQVCEINFQINPLKRLTKHEFFFPIIKSGRSITAAPDKIFTFKPFFEGIDIPWGHRLKSVEVLITCGNRNCEVPEFFFLFCCFHRNLTSESDWTHHFGYDTNFFSSEYGIFEKIKNHIIWLVPLTSFFFEWKFILSGFLTTQYHNQ